MYRNILPGNLRKTSEKSNQGNMTIKSFYNLLSCNDLLDKINWKNNVQYPANITLDQAIILANEGKDDGLMGIYLILPRDDNCQKWLDYLGYLTLLYRNNNQ